MDASGNQVGDQYVALLSLAFLQANCGNAECRKELLSMGRELNVTLDINANSGVCSEIIDDGELETDGHSSSSISGLLADLQPAAALQRPAVQEVAAELRVIADQFEQDVMAQAAQNLSRTLQNSPFNNWKDYLSSEVDRAMSCSDIRSELAQEKVMLALTLTLVKGVCELVPSLTRNLFDTMVQYISHRRAR